ncbi:CHAP domain-containing protein [Actinotignum sp. GS-2025b]|uniref:CHAP domain-containing protein n=1 Tax=Actinotignum sp. GS-2025b TaxID=3427275 RepID=UPI003F4657F9
MSVLASMNIRDTSSKKAANIHTRRDSHLVGKAGRLVGDVRELRSFEGGEVDEQVGTAFSIAGRTVGRKTWNKARQHIPVLRGHVPRTSRVSRLTARRAATVPAMSPVRSASSGRSGSSVVPGLRRATPGSRQAQRAGRAALRGGYRPRLAARALNAGRVVAVKIAAAIASGVSMIAASPVLIAGLVASIMIIAIVSFIPNWIVNLVVDDELPEVAFPIQDDYPWRDKVRDSAGNATEVFNTVNTETLYYFGNCTDFVYWRVNRDMGGGPGRWVYRHGDLTPAGGNGSQWGDTANLPGWPVINNAKDVKTGDVVSFKSGVAGHDHPAGHVGYAAANTDGTLLTENYGNAAYYLERFTHTDLQKFLDDGRITVRRNPDLGRRAATGEIVRVPGGSSAVLDTALAYQGVPYVHGGQSPSGWDCIGFVAWVYRQHGVTINYFDTTGVLSYGRRVPYSQAKPGDILYWPGHVAISLGDGRNVAAWNEKMGTTVGPDSWCGEEPPVVIRMSEN